MDPKIIVIAAGLFVALAGYVCLSPDQFALLRLPAAFAALGMERVVTGLALMLLGFVGALSEVWGDPPRRRRAQIFAFGDGLAAENGGTDPVQPRTPGLLLLDPETDAAPTVPKSDATDAIETPPEP